MLALESAYHTRSATRARWRALILLAAIEFMILLDTAIVNIALPAIKSGLHFGEADLPWIQNAYLLVFGGLLLLGGRAADLFGRRRLYMLGLAVFTASSLLAGLAPTGGILLLARALQGVGAAVVIPAEQSLLVTIFTDPEERNRALGVWGAAGAAGGIFGILLGGVITQLAGWPWIFLINVPVGAVVLLLSPSMLPESRADGDWRKIDVFGALTATAAILLVAYAPVAVQQWGWGSARTLGTLATAAVLALLFLGIEARVADPLVPLRIFRNRNANGANIVSFLVGAAHAPMFYLLSLYYQQALHYDALTAGLAIMPVGIGSLLFSFLLLPKALDHLGARGMLAGGMLLLAAGLVLLARAPSPSNYVLDILPASLIVAIGLPGAFAGSNIAAVTAVAPAESGLASGLMNTAQRVGSGIGIAILTAVFVAQSGPLNALTGAALSAGFRAGFLGAAAFALLGAALTVLLIRQPRPQPQSDRDGTDGQRELAHADGHRLPFHH
jgi:EmrB/QacA subfamily drug resistance transporter